MQGIAKKKLIVIIGAVLALLLVLLASVIVIVQANASSPSFSTTPATRQFSAQALEQLQEPDAATPDTDTPDNAVNDETADPNPESTAPSADALFTELGVVEDYRTSFEHGEKPAEYQKYIMLHDTEGWGSPDSVINYWDGNGNLVAAHFIVGTDGSVYQCVPMNKIAHHAGYGNVGHNAAFGVEDESRDDMLGTVSIGSAHPDYGMNSYSIGIEMVHVGDGSAYPEAQLEALDKLIAYIDAYYGFESGIVVHNEWRVSNSDTSAEFAQYLANYRDHRSYK